MTVRDAAKIIGCSPSYVRYLARTGVIESEHVNTPYSGEGYVYSLVGKSVREFAKKPTNGKGCRGKSRRKRTKT